MPAVTSLDIITLVTISPSATPPPPDDRLLRPSGRLPPRAHSDGKRPGVESPSVAAARRIVESKTAAVAIDAQ